MTGGGPPALPPAGVDAGTVPDIHFTPVVADDFERLLALRLLVMREHLERIGRFDPDRARARFAAGFVPADMKLIQVQDRFAGCVSLNPCALIRTAGSDQGASDAGANIRWLGSRGHGPAGAQCANQAVMSGTHHSLVSGAHVGGLELAHFYLHPDFQNRGLGGAVLKMLLTGTDAAGATVRLGVLKQSPARRFYERHGFVWEREGEWDDFLLRRPVPAEPV